MEGQRGTVTAVAGTDATVTMDEGSTRVVPVPDMILVEAGMPVTVIDIGDGKPIYKWGD